MTRAGLFPARRLHAQSAWDLAALLDELRHELESDELLSFIEDAIADRRDLMRRERAA